MNHSVGRYTDLLVRENDNIVEFDYGCGPSSGPISSTHRCGVYGDDEDNEYEEVNDKSDEDVDDESNGDLDVKAVGHVSSFQTFNQVLENEQGIYVFAHAASYDLLNKPDAKEPDKSSPIHYHLPPSSQFKHIKNFGKATSSDWTSWVQHTTGYLSG